MKNMQFQDITNKFHKLTTKWCNCYTIPYSSEINVKCFDYELEAIDDFEKNIEKYNSITDTRLMRVNPLVPMFITKWHIQNQFKKKVVFEK